MRKQHQDNIITCKPVPVSLHQHSFNQQLFGFSPICSHSMPAPQAVYSPLLVVTPMHTPMVEEEEEIIHQENQPTYLEQDVFTFDEQMEHQRLMQQNNFITQPTFEAIKQRDNNNPKYGFELPNEDECFEEFEDEESEEFGGEEENIEENELIQEMFNRINQLKRDGDERNKILQNIIENQK